MEQLSSSVKHSILALATIFSVRMLGLFMIFPILSLHVKQWPDATPFLLGLAMGAYGLTQAMLQIPFGRWSDRWGRKPVITIGLILFALGGVMAANAHSLLAIAIGRAVQGSGAVAAAIMALAADLTPLSHRTRALATIGASIGVSFSLALIVGPLLDQWVGMSGVFWMTAVLAIIAIGILWGVVPTPETASRLIYDEKISWRALITHPKLWRLNLSVMSLHFMLTATFVVTPLVLRDVIHLPESLHWKIYIPSLLGGIIGMIPLVILAEKYHRMKEIFPLSIALLFIGLAGLGSGGYHGLWLIGLLLWVFFVGFNTLEAILPSLISKIVASPSEITMTSELKGAALGIHATYQFIGAFLGGMAGGMLLHYGYSAVFLGCAAIAIIWSFWAVGLFSYVKVEDAAPSTSSTS